MKEKKKVILDGILTIIQNLVLVMLIILIFCMISCVEKIQGTARVINYAGIVRGATQRLVKLEMIGEENLGLEKYLDEIMKGLLYGGGQYELISLDDKEYQEELLDLSAYWEELKIELEEVRTQGYENTEILQMSEEYFQRANKTVASAEKYAEHYAKLIAKIEMAMVACMIIMAIFLLKRTLSVIRMMKVNKELKVKAYIDVHTGLPNKSKCEEILQQNEGIAACIMLDLNNLKMVNDSLGHVAGDSLIRNFAHIVRSVIPEHDFVGRYGGDEFVIFMQKADRVLVKEYLEKIKDGVEHYNEYGRGVRMSYAWGYAMAEEYQGCSLKALLDQADKNMYEQKRYMKEQQTL